MKKIIVFLILSVMLISCSCGGKTEIQETEKQPSAQTTVRTTKKVKAATTAPVPESTTAEKETTTEPESRTESPTESTTAEPKKSRAEGLERTDEEGEINGFLWASSDDIAEFERIFSLPVYEGGFPVEYDCETATAETVYGLFRYFSGFDTSIYDYYFDDSENAFNTVNDPENLFPYNGDLGGIRFNSISKDNFEWICENVFNVKSPEKLDKISSPAGQMRYLHNGRYYINNDVGGIEWDYELMVDGSSRLADGRFVLDVSVRDIIWSPEKSVNAEIIAGLKEIDGKRVWSVFSIN